MYKLPKYTYTFINFNTVAPLPQILAKINLVVLIFDHSCPFTSQIFPKWAMGMDRHQWAALSIYDISKLWLNIFQKTHIFMIMTSSDIDWLSKIWKTFWNPVNFGPYLLLNINIFLWIYLSYLSNFYSKRYQIAYMRPRIYLKIHWMGLISVRVFVPEAFKFFNIFLWKFQNQFKYGFCK